jgi:ubiquinol-cytochrome c reductase cytochrome b subunit
VGSVVLPGLAILALLLVPFIDRGRMVHVTRRTFATGVVLLAGAGWAGLTVAAVKSTPPESLVETIDYSGPTDWIQLSPEEMAGVAHFREENCKTCHALNGRGSSIGPDLTRIAVRKDAAWMIQHFKRPSAMVPGSFMPPIQLPDAQLNSLAAFLLKLNPQNASALNNAPEFAAQGALVYQNNHCSGCHLINGVGMRIGPPLNGLSKRQTRIWVEQHFADPEKLSPGTIMPAYKFSPRDLQNLVDYLFSLPE